MNPEKENTPTPREQLGILIRPNNLLKTVGTLIPLSSPLVEMQNQIEGAQLDHRLTQVETGLEAFKSEKSAPKTPVPSQEWPSSASEYFHRSCDIAVAYDGGIDSRDNGGHELILPISHGCLIGGGEFLTCKEALETAQAVATYKSGRMVILAGGAWYNFTADEPDATSGLSIGKLSPKDEQKWSEFSEILTSRGLQAPVEASPTAVRSSVMPWIGHEIAFLHSGEAEDASSGLGSYSALQFDTAVISHFRRVRDGGIKTFVTSVLPGRVTRAGSAVFSKDGTLLGVFSDTMSLKSDAGRRGVIRSLLGHPRFMPLNKTA
jgi:hypothetical protein